MMEIFWLGALGAMLIMAAWLMELLIEMRRKKAAIDLKFAAVYLLGNMSLTIYSFMIKDPVYMALNSGIMVFVVFEIIYTIKIMKGK